MKGPERVQAALKEAGLDIHIVQLQESARTAQLAADALGTALGSIVKSLLFLADGDPVSVLVAGDRRADPAKLKRLLGAQRVVMADAERVRQETGFSIGVVEWPDRDAVVNDHDLIFRDALLCNEKVL